MITVSIFSCSRAWLAALLLGLSIVGVGCELSVPTPPPTTGGDGGNGGGQDTGVTISVTPSSIRVLSEGRQQFEVAVIGTAQIEVRWDLVSGVGNISTAGLYTAPTVSGTDTLHAIIRAVLLSDTTLRDSALVMIVAKRGGGDTLPPGVVCFQREVLPIIQSNCATTGCHVAPETHERPSLTTYSEILKWVRPSQPSESDLYKKITIINPRDRMPPTPAERLTDAQIDVIKRWIEQGAKNTTCSDNGGVCDTTNVTYASTIRPIIENNCLGCHSGTSLGGGLSFSTVSGVQSVARSGRLLGSVNQLYGYSQMPRGGAKLLDCDIAKITAWVNAGALDN